MFKRIRVRVRNWLRRRHFNSLPETEQYLVKCFGCTPDQMEAREAHEARREQACIESLKESR